MNLVDGKQSVKISEDRFDISIFFSVESLKIGQEREIVAMQMSQLLKSGAYLIVDDVHIGLSFTFVCYSCSDDIQNMTDSFQKDK